MWLSTGHPVTMTPSENPPAQPPSFSATAQELVDQLHDIAHDEGDARQAGIAWYTEDEQAPEEALLELTRTGLFVTSRRALGGGEEVDLRFAEAGLAAYRESL